MLLEAKLGVHFTNNNSTPELVVKLEFIPLLIVRAAANISQRARGCSSPEFLDDFRTDD